MRRGAIQFQDECQKLVLYEFWLLLNVAHSLPRDHNRRRLQISYCIEKESNKKNSSNNNTLLSCSQKRKQLAMRTAATKTLPFGF